MSGCVEYGICDVCGKETTLSRKYFRYDVNCECHSPNHFEIVWHCNECEPIEPKITEMIVKNINSLGTSKIEIEISALKKL